MMRSRTPVAASLALAGLVAISLSGAPASAQDADTLLDEAIASAQWMWYPEWEPRESVPIMQNSFRCTIDLPEGRNVTQALMAIAGDERLESYRLNGEDVGRWQCALLAERADITDRLQPGKNVVALSLFSRSRSPAGVIGAIAITFAEGDPLVITTGASWRVGKTREVAEDWYAPDFDDSQWEQARELGQNGIEPWRKIAVRRIPEQRSFPGASGAGAYARGGRGGQVIPVTTLEDYVPGEQEPVPGSLRAACDTPGPRTIVFQVAGNIDLKDWLIVREPYLTIAGQTAPGDGICIRDFPVQISTHDVVLRYLRLRLGDRYGDVWSGRTYTDGRPNSVGPHSLYIVEACDVIVDHCSTTWAIDEVLTAGLCGRVTIQWSIIAEALHDSFHPKGPHGMGSVLGGADWMTVHHCLYSNNPTRSPRPSGDLGFVLDFINNTIYLSAGYTTVGDLQMNYIGNYIKRCNDSRAFSLFGIDPRQRMHASGNWLADPAPGYEPQDQWRGLFYIRPYREQTEFSEEQIAGAWSEAPIPMPEWAAIEAEDARVAHERVMADAGATLPVRDAADARIIADVRNGTGEVVNSQEDVGGWPELAAGEPLVDADGDGMPDASESANGLDPRDPADASADPDGDGWTNIEECLNATDPREADAA